MLFEVLNPTYEAAPQRSVYAPRLASLQGRIVGVLSNGKHGTAPFFDALASELVRSYGVADVVRVTKPNYSAPAGDEIFDRAKHWHALIAGVGD